MVPQFFFLMHYFDEYSFDPYIMHVLQVSVICNIMLKIYHHGKNPFTLPLNLLLVKHL